MEFRKIKFLIVSSIIVFFPGLSLACGNTSDGFKEWLSDIHKDALKKGMNPKVLNQIFSGITYSLATIHADRNQHNFKLSFDEFLKKRGSENIIKQGKKLKTKYANLFASLKQDYGIPAGPLITIWGMETGFGAFMGNQHTLSAIATLSYDCRRSDFFIKQFYTALELVAEGKMSDNSRGAVHGEIGHFQFLSDNLKKFGVDGDNDGKIDVIKSKVDALTSTANFLKESGWQAGDGFQPGEQNFKVIQTWNAATLYQKAIAYIAAKIDGIKLKDTYK